MNSYSKKGRYLTNIILDIFQLNGKLISLGDSITTPFGLTASRWQIMGVIAEEPSTVSGIARIRGLKRQSVQRTADLLQEEGYAQYQENPEHKTAKLLVITDKGKDAFNKIMHVYIAWINEIAKQIELSDLETTSKIFTHIKTNLKSENENFE